MYLQKKRKSQVDETIYGELFKQHGFHVHKCHFNIYPAPKKSWCGVYPLCIFSKDCRYYAFPSQNRLFKRGKELGKRITSFEFKPFEFKEAISILKSTGEKANCLSNLREVISKVSDESIFHHTGQYFLKEHFLGYTNDFAQWAGENLEERALAERLSNIDPYTFKSIAGTRKELLRVIDDYCNDFPEPRCVLSGHEFYFNETITLIFPVGVKAKNLTEFLIALRHVDTGCIHFHFYEARIRLGGGIDDFSRWFKDTLNRKKLANRIRTIDLFMHNIEGIREHIIEMVEEDLRAHIEGLKT